MNLMIEEKMKNNIILDKIWIKKSLQKITNIKDLKLTEKINPCLDSYIHRIEEISFYGKYFRNSEKSIEDLAKELNIPASHIFYLFKYHSKESFTDFKKIVRIEDAVELCSSGFLQKNTLDALATEVGFTSYSSFFTSFKSILGVSPQEYFENLKMLKN